MKALVLAGGYATRMRPLSCTKPKFLLPVAGRPMFEWTLKNLVKNNVDEVILAVNYKSDELKKHFGKKFGKARIRYVRDLTPLGTGGPIKNAQKLLREAVFAVMNGDILSEVKLKEMLKVHFEKGAVATVALHEVDDPSGFGVVKLGEDMRVESFVEKPKPQQALGRLINAGVYLMSPEIFRYIPAGRKVSVEKEVFPILAGKSRLYGYKYSGMWFDVGKITSYRDANFHLLERICAGNAIARRGVKVGHEVKLEAPTLMCEQTKIGGNSTIGPYTYLGRYVHVGRNVRAVKSIVFNNARIGDSSNLVESIIGEGAVIGRGVSLGRNTVLGDYVVVADGVRIAGGTVVCPGKEVAEDVLEATHLI